MIGATPAGEGIILPSSSGDIPGDGGAMPSFPAGIPTGDSIINCCAVRVAAMLLAAVTVMSITSIKSAGTHQRFFCMVLKYSSVARGRTIIPQRSLRGPFRSRGSISPLFTLPPFESRGRACPCPFEGDHEGAPLHCSASRPQTIIQHRCENTRQSSVSRHITPKRTLVVIEPAYGSKVAKV